MADNDFQIPDFNELPPAFSGEVLDPAGFTGDFAGGGDGFIDNGYLVSDPGVDLSNPFIEEVDGWAVIYPNGLGNGIGAMDAYVFFPHSDGTIKPSMPTLQDTGTALDDATRPSVILAGSDPYSQYLVWDSTADTSRIYYAPTATNVATLLNSTEEFVEIGTFTLNGGSAEGYDQKITGPEMLGGGVTCTALKASLSGTSASVSDGFVDNTIPTMGGTSLAAATPPTLTVAIGDTIYIQVTGDLIVTGTAAPYEITGWSPTFYEIVAGSTDPGNVPTFDSNVAGNLTGVYTKALAAVVDDGSGNPTLSNGRCGHWETLFCEGSTTIKIIAEDGV